MRKKKDPPKDIYLNDPVNRLAMEGATREEIKEFLRNDEAKLAEMEAKEFWADFLMGNGLPGIVHVTAIAETDIIDYSHMQRRLAYEMVVRPKLPWNKINAAVAELDIEPETLDIVVFNLKPFFHEPIIKQYNQFEKLVTKKCAEFSREIKRLAPLIAQIKLQCDRSPLDKNYKSASSASSAVVTLERLLFFYKQIVDLGQPLLKSYYDKTYGFDKEIGKVSHQKHRFWNTAIVRAINLLNDHYHDPDCTRRCAEIHIGSIKKVAALLKILYPTIWKEDAAGIARRIKTRYYSNLP